MQLSLSALVAFAVLSSGILVEGAFSSECNVNSLSLCGSTLRGSCNNDAGVEQATAFDLDSCIGFSPDHDGFMWCEKEVSLPFGQGCQPCALNGTDMWCSCLGNGPLGIVWNWNVIDLNACIDANNGKLSCRGP